MVCSKSEVGFVGFLRRFHEDEVGADSVEQVMIIAVMAMVMMAVMTLMKGKSGEGAAKGGVLGKVGDLVSNLLGGSGTGILTGIGGLFGL